MPYLIFNYFNIVMLLLPPFELKYFWVLKCNIQPIKMPKLYLE